jgi:alcohol dehydrogenase class IV
VRFELATPARIVFGDGVAAEVPALGRGAVGEPTAPVRAAVVVGSSPARTAALRHALEEAGVTGPVLPVRGEPTVTSAREGAEWLREEAVDVVVAIGGGSVLDTAKAVAALAANPGDVLDYLEVVGRGRPLARPSIPLVAVPTTAGSGSEVTRNAVLTATEERVKVSLRSASMLPRVALVDPMLTLGLPPAVTASTGLDALTQVIEPFVSPFANPVTDALARDGIGRAARSLRRAYIHGDDVAARRDMALTSLFGGLALANAKLGAVHGLAGVIGGMVEAPHGAVCARLLPLVIEASVAALRDRAPSSPAIGRYDEVARLLTGRSDAVADDGAAWLREECAALEVAPLGAYGIGWDHLAAIAEGAERASSTKGNPVVLTRGELLGVLERAL